MRGVLWFGWLALAAAAAHAEKLSIERIYGGGSLSGAAPLHLSIAPDGQRVTFLRAQADDQTTFDLWEYDVRRGTTRRLVDARVLAPHGERLSAEELARRERARSAGRHGIVDYVWAPDGKKLLFPLGDKLYLYDLTVPPARALRELATGGAVLDPQVSPRGRYVSYVRKGNLWLIDLAGGPPRPLTDDGGGTVHNGEAEFIAQEELGRAHGYWWAPDESAIAFERYDEAPVAVVKRFEVYADHTAVIEQRYPAAGGANVAVRLGVIAPTGGAARFVATGDGDFYLARLDWLPNGQAFAWQRLTRDQRRLDLIRVEAASLVSRTLLTDTSDTWIDLNDDLRFLADDAGFLWGSDRSGWHHVYLYTMAGTLVRAVSAGDWNVDGVLAVDERAGLVYVDSNRDFVPDRQLYVLTLDGRTAQAPRRISREDGVHAAVFARDARFYVDTFADPNTPPRVAVHEADGRLRAYVERNPLDARHPYWPYRDAHVVPEFGTLAAADGQTLYYRLYRPLGFDPARRYPVVDTYYGGPHGQVVVRGWVDYFAEYLAQHGYAVFSLDNRGMARRGRRFSDGIYRQFGRLDVEDQATGIAWLKRQPWVDGAHIGVFGWSYGGYLTAMLLARDSDEIAAGVAVAPVVDWRRYDTAYTERYLDTPERNPRGYELADVRHWLDGLRSPLLLMHGMADDNVLFTHSTELMAALQERGSLFELMTYPGGKHGLSTPAMRTHAYRTIADFFARRLGPTDANR